MDLQKLLEKLGVSELNESQKTDFEETLKTIIEAKAVELKDKQIKEELDTAKEELKEQMNEEFENYTKDITSQFSSFVDHILKEELVIPEKVMKYARIGEVYHDVMEEIKKRIAIEEGLIDEDMKDVLKEAKEEILSSREDLDKLTKKVLTMEDDAKKMAAELYLHEKCAGLSESAKKKVMQLLDGILVKEDIDKKFATVVESLSLLEADEEEDDEEEENGKGKEEEEEEEEDKKDKKMDESSNSWVASWQKILHDGRF